MATPTPVFPSAIATNEDLKVGLNLVTTNLKVACSATDDVLFVNDAAQFGASILVSIEKEIIAIYARNVSTPQLFVAPGGRGFDGTAAAPHPAGAKVQMLMVAYHHNALSVEIQAIEQTLGPNLANVGAGLPGVYVASKYTFTPQTPGGNLVVGNNSITLTPVPVGVNGSDLNHWLYVDQGTGTPEPVLITGGSAVSGAPTGTLIINCKNAHSGSWRIGTATGGAQEAAVIAAAAGGGLVWLNSCTVHAPIHPPYQQTVWFQGNGRSATVISVAADFPLTESGVFVFAPGQVSATNADSGGVTNLTISFIQPDSTNLASYNHWPPAVYASGDNHVTLADAIVERAWDVFTSPLSNGVNIRNVGMSFFHRGITVDQCFDLLDITNVESWPFGCTINQTNTFLAVATNNYFLDIQQVDFGWLDGVISVSGKFARLTRNAAGGVPMLWGTNIDMDTNGGFEMFNGYACFTNVSVSTLPGTQPFSISGGTLALDGVSIFNSGATAPMFSYNPTQPNSGACAGYRPGLFIRGLGVSASAEDQYIIFAGSGGTFVGAATVQVIGASISRSPGVYLSPLFNEAPGTGNITMDISHVHLINNAGNSSYAFNFLSLNPHSVSYCNGPGGWAYSVPATTRWFNNSGFAANVNAVPAPLQCAARVSVASLASATTENFITPETGAANAIAGALLDASGVAIAYAAGLRISVLLAHPLQAGANTMNLNALGAKAIKSGRNPANNITVAYVAGAIFNAIYDGTQFLDTSQ